MSSFQPTCSSYCTSRTTAALFSPVFLKLTKKKRRKRKSITSSSAKIVVTRPPPKGDEIKIRRVSSHSSANWNVFSKALRYLSSSMKGVRLHRSGELRKGQTLYRGDSQFWSWLSLTVKVVRCVVVIWSHSFWGRLHVFRINPLGYPLFARDSTSLSFHLDASVQWTCLRHPSIRISDPSYLSSC